MIRFLSQNVSSGKIISSLACMLSSVFAPVQSLILISLEFVTIDFIVGVIASRVRAKRAGRLSEWGFESAKAWHTIWKAVFVFIGICLAHQLNEYIFTFVDLHLTNVFCGFVCGVEFWSILENSACISNHPVFRWLKKYMGKKVKEGIGIDPEDIDKAASGEDPKKPEPHKSLPPKENPK